MKSRAKYYAERMYPYIFSLAIVLCLRNAETPVIENPNYIEVLSGLVTLDSIVIGFLGAIMPVILSMKNESKFVKYVFENDKQGLFSKYLKVTVFTGLLSAVLSLIMHLRGSMPEFWVSIAFKSWMFFTVLFLVSTYRSMSYMITLVFSKDNFEDSTNDHEREKTRKEKELEDKYSK